MHRPSVALAPVLLLLGSLLCTAVHAQVYDRIAFMTDRDTPEGAQGAGMNWEIYSTNIDGSDQVNLTNRQSREIDPAWSPDGTTIAFASNRSGTFQIYTMDPDGNSQQQLTLGPGHCVWPAWSPDGSQLAYASDGGGDLDIYVLQSDGSDAVNITAHAGPDYAPTWSSDGTQIAFMSIRDRPSGVYTVDFSYYHSASLQPADIFVMDALGGAATNQTRMVQDEVKREVLRIGSPSWCPVDDRIAFAFLWWDSPYEAGNELNIIGADGGGRVRLTFRSRANLGSCAWSPDGTMIAVTCDAFTGGLGYGGITIVSASGQVLYQVTGPPPGSPLFGRASQASGHPTWSPLSGRVSSVQQASWGQIKGLFLAAPDTARQQD